MEPNAAFASSNDLAVWNIVEPLPSGFLGDSWLDRGRALAFLESLLRALRPELGWREEIYLGQTETPRRAWGFVFSRCRSHLQSGLASSLEQLASCRLIGVRGKASDEGFTGARRSTATGSARWFPYPTITWEPPLLTWVV